MTSEKELVYTEFVEALEDSKLRAMKQELLSALDKYITLEKHLVDGAIKYRMELTVMKK
jgi:septum formation topological specificity factor MinE